MPKKSKIDLKQGDKLIVSDRGVYKIYTIKKPFIKLGIQYFDCQTDSGSLAVASTEPKSLVFADVDKSLQLKYKNKNE